ncbi:MAG: hypothetical protein A2X09_12055 [Bacteroidetes bacterium GWF2_43_11]|nr:MAG: hypothetical protein A2X09_12055 [Bacteroidetes bacterium GWF2_43_11]
MRSIMRNKLFTVINVVGLSIGIGVAVMIFLYVEYERGFDRFHQKADRIYRIVQESVNAEGVEQDGSIPFPIGHALRTDYPGMVLTRYFNDAVQDVVVGERVFQLENILYVDSVFFNIFDYQWYKGNPESCLRQPSSTVLTRSTAIKLFGEADPIGKIIKFGKGKSVTVTGILEDPPKQSSNPFSVVIPIGFLDRDYMGFDYDKFSTTLSGFECCVLLKENESPMETDSRLAQVHTKYREEGGAPNNRRYYLMPLTQTHFEPEFSSISNMYSTSRMTLRVYVLIGILILGVGIVNFVNLATAQAMRRSREVGIRKAVGALKGNIFRQFILETSVITLMAVVGGLILAEIFLPYLSTFLGINSTLSVYSSRLAIVFIPLLTVVVVILTGFYPAMILSGFNPIKALKGKNYGRHKGQFTLSSCLVVFQFVISIILIISTVVIARQMNYIGNRDLGFAKESRMMVGLPSGAESKLDALRNDLMESTAVISVSFGIGGPASGRNMTTNFQMHGQKHEEELRMNLKPCDTNYLKTTGLKLIAGEWFRVKPRKAPNDSVDNRPNHKRITRDDDFKVVVNKKTTENMGCKDPTEAIGKKILISGNDATVVGVIEDFNLYSLHDPMMATAFFYAPNRFAVAIIHYADNQESKVLTLAESNWKRYFPDTYFSAQTYKDELSDYYESDARTLGLVKFFSVIAILIGCMGLFGLVSFMVMQRTKEIGIRKVLGASVSTITNLLLRTFIIWIGIANLIAWPLAWYAMNRWLQNFAYHIEFEFWIFGVAAIASLLVGALTVAWHAVRAAMTDPVEAIRYE